MERRARGRVNASRQTSMAKTLKDARLDYFWTYHLRRSYASRLSATGVCDLFVARMIGHSSPSILQTYSKAIDEYRRDAVRKLEKMRCTRTRLRIDGS
jgi:integrase